MSPRRAEVDLPSYDNQYGNGNSRGGAINRRYVGDLPEYENQYGSGGHRNKFKNVSFFSRRLNKVVKFKAKASKKKRRKRNVRRTKR